MKARGPGVMGKDASACTTVTSALVGLSPALVFEVLKKQNIFVRSLIDAVLWEASVISR